VIIIKFLNAIGYSRKLDYKDKLLYLMVLSTILVAGFYLTIYFLFIPFQYAIITHIIYISLSISLFYFLKIKKYPLVKFTMIIMHMTQLTLAVFVWFPITTGYNLYYFLVPMSSFLMMQYDNIKERFFLTSLSVLSAFLYISSAILPLNNYLYQTSDVMNRFLSGMSIISIMFPMIIILTKFTKELYLSHATLKKLANTDALTQITNRKALYEQGISEFELASNDPQDFTLLLFDIDHFKNINDQFGHPVGDRLLQELTSLVQEHTRNEDTLARYGGEEFAILLRKTNYCTGYAIAENLLKIISQKSFLIDQITIQISVSIGIAQYSKKLKNFDHMMSVVDQALYEAKNNGRNQVISAKHIS